MSVKKLAYAFGASLILMSSIFALKAWALDVRDFHGNYSMSHDGWKGNLTLFNSSDPEFRCNPLCGMYTDSGGRNYLVKVSNIQGYKITFYVIGIGDENAEGTGGQKFEGYLMTQTKDAIAGNTWWHSRPFGFYAVKH
ncbi:MAG: hypothetical protein HC862_11065 [Scytonema sp. RU_4_4]|nr:hypothetical protein [Scytonema sp. RU_4_4]